MKTAHDCKKHGSVTEFYTWASGKTACKLCHRAKVKRAQQKEGPAKALVRAKAWRAANKGKVKGYDKEWKEKNKERVREWNRKRLARWRKNNLAKARMRTAASAALFRRRHPERVKEINATYYQNNREERIKKQAKWQRDNPEKVCRIQQRRRARKAGVEATLTKEEWEGIVLRYKSRCAYCRMTLKRPHMDHVIPIIKGGPHTATNVVPCCHSCNSRKGPRLLTPRQPEELDGL